MSAQLYFGHWAVEFRYADGRALRVYRPVGPQGPVDIAETERACRLLASQGIAGDIAPEDAMRVCREVQP